MTKNTTTHLGYLDPAGFTAACPHNTLIVTGGTVRCVDCFTWMPEHPGSAPRPGLIQANQEK